MCRQNHASGVGGPARQPHVADAMAVEAVFRCKQRLVGQHLHRQRRAERADPVARPVGAGGEKGGAAIRGAGNDHGVRRQPEGRCRIGGNAGDGGTGRQHVRQQAGIRLGFADPVRPASGDRVVAGLQGIVFVGNVVQAGEMAHQPVGLMDDAVYIRLPLERQQFRQARGGAVGSAFLGGMPGDPA